MNYFANFKGLPSQAYKLGFLRVIVSLGSMTFAYASLIFTGVLGLSEMTASIIAMCLAFGNAAGSVLGGKLADTVGRKKTYLFFTWSSAVFITGGGILCRSMAVIPLLMLANMCSNGCYPALTALLSDCTDDNTRMGSFSFIYLCANLGFAIGPSIAGFIFYEHMALCFYIQAVVYFLTGFYMLFFVEENYDLKAGRHASIKHRSEGEKSTLALLAERRPVFIFIVSLIVLTMCYNLTSFLLPLQMQANFGMDVSSRFSGLTWMVNGMLIVFLGPLLLDFIKKHHQFINVVIGSVLYTAGFGLYAFVKTPYMFLAASVVWSVGEILISTGAGAYIAENSPATHRGRFQSFYETGRLIGRAISPPLFTLVVQFAGHSGSWVVCSAICLAVSCCMAACYRKIKVQKRQRRSL